MLSHRREQLKISQTTLAFHVEKRVILQKIVQNNKINRLTLKIEGQIVTKISILSLLSRTILNGRMHKLLVDTGSSSSLLSKNMVEQLFGPVSEIQQVEKSSKLTPADGVPLDIKGKNNA